MPITLDQSSSTALSAPKKGCVEARGFKLYSALDDRAKTVCHADGERVLTLVQRAEIHRRGVARFIGVWDVGKNKPTSPRIPP